MALDADADAYAFENGMKLGEELLLIEREIGDCCSRLRVFEEMSDDQR